MVDIPPPAVSDKFLTNGAKTGSRRAKKRGEPHCVVRHHSVSVPVYAGVQGGKTRFTIAFYRDGLRQRRTFTDLDAAKREAKQVAEKILRGMQSQNDLRPAERDAFLAAQRILKDIDTPLVSVVEEYVGCRKLLGKVPLHVAVEEFLRRTNGVKLGVKVPEAVEELIAAKEQDGMSSRYMSQLRSVLGIFAKAFLGPIMHVKAEDIDGWLRSSKLAPVTRNNRLTVIRVLFSFAKQRNYVPNSERSAAELVAKVKTGGTDAEIFQPDEMEKILLAAPVALIPYLAISAFSGVRGAELSRLDWAAVDLDRRLIQLRAGQAKTASRRIVPISENLFAWLSLVQEREGKVLKQKTLPRQATELTRSVGLEWPNNVLRHSFISYRVAQIQDVNQVALEAGNSAAIIFRNYRELVTEEAAEKWFSIRPPEGWTPPEPVRKRSPRTKRRKKS